jgi:hypothetical protein
VIQGFSPLRWSIQSGLIVVTHTFQVKTVDRRIVSSWRETSRTEENEDSSLDKPGQLWKRAVLGGEPTLGSGIAGPNRRRKQMDSDYLRFASEYSLLSWLVGVA